MFEDDINLHLSWVETRLLEMTEIPPIVFHHKPPIEPRMSAIDRLKEKALRARSIAPDAIKKFEADLDGLIAQESDIEAKRVAAVSPHQEAIAGVKGELDGLKSAIDILSNGEPA
jgi:hypothetical protein